MRGQSGWGMGRGMVGTGDRGRGQGVSAIMAASRSNPRVYWRSALIVHTEEQNLI